MNKVIVAVPEGTIARKCGEKYMACVIDDEGTLRNCTDFFKTKEAAEGFVKENPDYLMYGVNCTEAPPGTQLMSREVANDNS